jgi:hypothetical protein
MKAIKPPKRPNPTGLPLPSRFARIFYQATTGKEPRQKWLGDKPRFTTHSGTVIKDFYGAAFVVGHNGELHNA